MTDDFVTNLVQPTLTSVCVFIKLNEFMFPTTDICYFFSCEIYFPLGNHVTGRDAKSLG